MNDVAYFMPTILSIGNLTTWSVIFKTGLNVVRNVKAILNI